MKAAPPVQADSSGIIESPLGGAAIQGILSITGSSDVPDFFAFDLYFGYTKDSSGTWFLIASSFTPVIAGTLAEWDTFSITDGEYNLRAVITLRDGSQIEEIVEGLRVRNYTIIETSTPTAVPSATITPTRDPNSIPLPTETPTPTMTALPPTATALPPNPAQLSASSVTNSITRGLLAALAILLFLGAYTTIQNNRKK